jgi:hypothetical protein
VIGFDYPVTGSFASSYLIAPDGLMAFFDAINKDGRYDGHPIKAIVEVHQSSSTPAQNALNALVSKERTCHNQRRSFFNSQPCRQRTWRLINLTIAVGQRVGAKLSIDGVQNDLGSDIPVAGVAYDSGDLLSGMLLIDTEDKCVPPRGDIPLVNNSTSCRTGTSNHMSGEGRNVGCQAGGTRSAAAQEHHLLLRPVKPHLLGPHYLPHKLSGTWWDTRNSMDCGRT